MFTREMIEQLRKESLVGFEIRMTQELETIEIDVKIGENAERLTSQGVMLDHRVTLGRLNEFGWQLVLDSLNDYSKLKEVQELYFYVADTSEWEVQYQGLFINTYYSHELEEFILEDFDSGETKTVDYKYLMQCLYKDKEECEKEDYPYLAIAAIHEDFEMRDAS